MAQDDFQAFIERIKQAESRGQRFDSKGKLLTSPKGAQGEMQVMPATQRDPGYGVAPVKNNSPDEIARVGRDLLRAFDAKYDGNKMYVAAAYNWGPGNVDKWIAGGADFNKLPKETQNYLMKVAPEALAQSRSRQAPATATAPAEPTMDIPLGISASAGGKTIAIGDSLAVGFAQANKLGGLHKGGAGPKAVLKMVEDYAANNSLDGVTVYLGTGLPNNPAQREFVTRQVELIKSRGGIPVLFGAGPGSERTPTTGQNEFLQSVAQSTGAQFTGPLADRFPNIAKQDRTGLHLTHPQYRQLFSQMGGTAPPASRPATATATAQPAAAATTTAVAPTAAAAPARAEDLGAGYKAALALAFLGEEEKERESTDDELRARLNRQEDEASAKELAEYKPVNALQDLEITALNPVKALRSAQPVEPVRMAAGGVPFNPVARITPSARSQLESIKADYDRYNAAVPGFNTALQKYQTEVYQPYEQAVNQYNAAVEAYNAGPREADFTGVAPTAPAEFSMTAPAAPSVTQAQYDQMAADARKSAARRQMALVVASDPERFGLSMNKFFADGGEVTGPTPEEIAAASRPATFNPQIARQGAAARALAAQRDVNLLPDPRTYAAVSGFLGQAPDQLGFSAMHPDIQGITKAGEVGFAASLVPVVAPVVAPVARAVGRAATAAGMRAEKALEAPVTRTLEGGGRSAEMLQALGAQPSFAVRPRGGHFELRPDRSGMGMAVWDDVKQTVSDTLANTADQPLNNWFSTKYATYLRRDLGTEGDPFVKAADAGKKLHIPNQPLDEDWQATLRFRRKEEGLPAQGFATTPYGKNVEDALDTGLNIRELGDLAGSPYARDRIPPGIMQFAETNPQMRVYSLDEILDTGPRAESLRNTMLEMRQPAVSFYGESVTIPKNYQLTNETLQGLTPVQASERAALFSEWKETARQRAASSSIYKNPNVDKTDAGDGFLWVNAPDLAEDPRMRQLVQDVGCDGGWCTREESTSLSYGSGNSRLSILLDNKARPVAQITIDTIPPTPEKFLKSLTPEQLAEFRASNPLYKYAQGIEELAALAETSPQYRAYLGQNPGKKSVTEIRGANNAKDLTNLRNLGKIQDRIKALDAQYGLQYVENLDGIGMTDLTSHIKDALTGLNVTLSKATSSATLKEASRLNGGSSYINNDPQEINRVIVQAYRNITQPPVNRAKGGMVERNYNDNRAYL